MNGHLIVAVCLALAGAGGCGRSSQDDAAADAGASAPSDSRPLGAALRGADGATVLLRTSLGTIRLKLNAAHAPLTVDNFLSQVDRGFYDQTIFHQVEPGYVILGGGFQADMNEKASRYSIPNEAHNGLSNRRGTIAMARSGDVVDSSTGQFFINLADNPQLDRQGDAADRCGYCVFGEVVEGMDVVDRIAQVQTHNVRDFLRLPVNTVLIESASRQR
jgi:peptidyl-prolyl cis-trans isomerase A (cyclophilin A)